MVNGEILWEEKTDLSFPRKGRMDNKVCQSVSRLKSNFPEGLLVGLGNNNNFGIQTKFVNSTTTILPSVFRVCGVRKNIQTNELPRVG